MLCIRFPSSCHHLLRGSPPVPPHLPLADSPRRQTAFGLLRQHSLGRSTVDTCHRCRCAPDRPAKSGHDGAQTLVSKRVESPDIGRPVGMQQAPLEGEQSSQDLQEASRIHGGLICLCCPFTHWTHLVSLQQAMAWDLTALTSHGL